MKVFLYVLAGGSICSAVLCAVVLFVCAIGAAASLDGKGLAMSIVAGVITAGIQGGIGFGLVRAAQRMPA